LCTQLKSAYIQAGARTSSHVSLCTQFKSAYIQAGAPTFSHVSLCAQLKSAYTQAGARSPTFSGFTNLAATLHVSKDEVPISNPTDPQKTGFVQIIRLHPSRCTHTHHPPRR
jgi:hypothetical protein